MMSSSIEEFCTKCNLNEGIDTTIQQENKNNTKKIIKKKFVWIDEDNKCSYILDLLKNQTDLNGLTLIIVQNRKTVDMLHEFLENNQFAVASLHSQRLQAQREEAIRSFTSGHKRILISTVIVTRGVYIPNFKYLIHFDFPSIIYDYLATVGRLDDEGEVTSFFTEKDRGIAADLLDFLRGAHEEIPEWLENLARETNNDDYLYEI